MAAPVTRHEKQKAAGLRPIRREEVVVLEHFYDALCTLVEHEHISDPLSLLIVYHVKTLLEAGIFLHKPLLQQVGACCYSMLLRDDQPCKMASHLFGSCLVILTYCTLKTKTCNTGWCCPACHVIW